MTNKSYEKIFHYFNNNTECVCDKNFVKDNKNYFNNNNKIIFFLIINNIY